MYYIYSNASPSLTVPRTQAALPIELKSHWNPLIQKTASSLIGVRTTEHFTETRDENFAALSWRALYFQGHHMKNVSIVF